MTRSSKNSSGSDCRADSKKVPAGRINRLFGTGGSVMLSLYGAFPDDFATDTPLFVTVDGLEVPLYCERFERRGASGAVATFADLDTERRVQEFLGAEFRVVASEPATDDDEFYLEDLVGFAVSGIETRVEGEPQPFAGRVTEYYDSETNPLFELEIDGRRVLVPAADEFFAHIDFEGRSLRLVLPEGLLNMEK